MSLLPLSQAPMGKCWGDIEEGVRIEVPNSDTSLSAKVYWIAEIIKLAGKTAFNYKNEKSHMVSVGKCILKGILLGF